MHFSPGLSHRIIFLCLFFLGHGLCLASGDTLRIRVLETHDPHTLRARCDGCRVQIFSGDFPNPIGALKPGEMITISRIGDEVHASLLEGSLHALSLRLVPEEGHVIAIEIDGKPLPRPRSYTGSLFVAPEAASTSVLRLINEVDLETYVASVLPKEYGFDDLEGTKAMAVVIRTYALRSSGKFGSDYDHVDHISSQVYEGASAITDISRRAARETQGEILTYKGNLIEAVHFASSGGHTADNETVWESGPLPYLRGKPDPYDASPYEHWESVISRTKLLNVLSDAYRFKAIAFEVGSRGKDGRVSAVSLVGAGGSRKTVQSNAFRLLMNRHFGVEGLRSTNFTMRREGDAYVFTGRGFGHGVGLNQWGAHEMARQGYAYYDILNYYYSDVTVQSMRPGDRTRRPLENAGTPTPVRSTASASTPEAKAGARSTSPVPKQEPEDVKKRNTNPPPRTGW